MTQPLDPDMPWESGLITVLGADPMSRRDFWGPQWIALTNSYSAPASAQPWNDALPTADPGHNRFTIYRKTQSGDGGGAFHVIEGIVGWYDGAPGTSPNDHYFNEFRARSLAALALQNGPNPLDPATFDTAAETFYNSQAWLNTAIPQLQAEVDRVASPGSGFQGAASQAFMSVITGLRDEMIDLISDMRNPRDWVQLLHDNATAVRTFWAQIQAAWQEYASRPNPVRMINSVLSQINAQVKATAAASGSDWTASAPAWDQISAWPFTIDFGAGPKTYDFHDPDVFHQLDLDMHGLWLGNAYTLDSTMLAQVAALRDSFGTTSSSLRDLPGANTGSNGTTTSQPVASSPGSNTPPAGTNAGGNGFGSASAGDSIGSSGGNIGASGGSGGGNGAGAPLSLVARLAGGGSFGGADSGTDFGGDGFGITGSGGGDFGGAAATTGMASAGDDVMALDPGAGDPSGAGATAAVALGGMLGGGFRLATAGDPDEDERRNTVNVIGSTEDAGINTSTPDGGLISIGSPQPDPVTEAVVVPVDQRRLVAGGGQFGTGSLGIGGSGGPSAQSAPSLISSHAASPAAGSNFAEVLGRAPAAGTSGLNAGGGPPFGPGNPPPATAFNVGRLGSAPLDPAGVGSGLDATAGSASGAPPGFGPMHSFGGGHQDDERDTSSWLAEDRITWGVGDGNTGTIGLDDEGDALQGPQTSTPANHQAVELGF